MKKKFAVFAVALLSACVVVKQANAIGLNIEIGDRGFYEGATYWDDGYEYVWFPGHWNHEHVWVHGHYARHGEFHKEHAHEHHHHEHHEHHEH